MNICVVGWYYLPEFYDGLPTPEKNCVDVIYHRLPPDDFWMKHGANVAGTSEDQNIGLEWGAYNYYLQKVWNGYESVLFMHDDVAIGPGFFEHVERDAKPFDLAFVFRDGDEERDNCGVHGRCVYMSERLLSRFRPIGFNYDKENRGDLIGPGYNKGIHRFREDVVWMKNRPSGADLKYGSIFVHADFGYRGKLGEEGMAVRKQLLVRP